MMPNRYDIDNQNFECFCLEQIIYFVTQNYTKWVISVQIVETGSILLNK
jgi:hypothetical protein